MINKKGITYVDWIISIGIFIIVVIALFAFLKPGIKPVFESKGLIDIVETNLFEDASWEIKNTPVIIYKLTNTHTTSQGIVKKSKITIKQKNPSWQFSTFYIPAPNPSLSNLQIDITPELATIKCSTSVCTTSIGQVYLTSFKTGDEQHELKAECTPNNNDHCFHTLGSSEDIKGLSKTKIDSLKNLNYNNAKQKWNYPQIKEFKIDLYYTGSNQTQTILNPKTKPTIQDNVFVKEINTWLLNKTGQRTPIKINIQVW